LFEFGELQTNETVLFQGGPEGSTCSGRTCQARGRKSDRDRIKLERLERLAGFGVDRGMDYNARTLGIMYEHLLTVGDATWLSIWPAENCNAADSGDPISRALFGGWRIKR
jgi:hypothetical protein